MRELLLVHTRRLHILQHSTRSFTVIIILSIILARLAAGEGRQSLSLQRRDIRRGSTFRRRVTSHVLLWHFNKEECVAEARAHRWSCCRAFRVVLSGGQCHVTFVAVFLTGQEVAEIYAVGVVLLVEPLARALYAANAAGMIVRSRYDAILAAIGTQELQSCTANLDLAHSETRRMKEIGRWADRRPSGSSSGCTISANTRKATTEIEPPMRYLQQQQSSAL